MNPCKEDRSGQALPAAEKFLPADGLDITGNESRVYSYKIGHQDVTIEQTTEQSADNLRELHLSFKMTAPMRFNINIWIPERCLNACISVNRQLLLGWFASEPRFDIPSVIPSPCAADEKIVSTLRPGKYQAINFRWQDGDHLVAYIID